MRWKEEEILFLKESYEKGISLENIATDLNRTYRSVQLKACKLGITTARQKLSEEDKQYILDNYVQVSVNQLSFNLGVDPSTVRNVLKAHNVINPRSKTSISVPWTKQEEEYLKNNYHSFSISVLSLNLGRTFKSVEKKAYTMKLGKKGRPNSSISSSEILCRDMLEELGLDYTTEYDVGNKFLVDFYIPKYNLCIEVQGDYWHYNPILYRDTPPNTKQLSTIEKDNRKKDYLLSLNYKVAYVWENDLKNNIKLCKEIIFDTLLPNHVNCLETPKATKLKRRLKSHA